MDTLLAVIVLVVVCSGAYIAVARARERFLTLRAGVLSRGWVAERALGIIADREAMQEAREAAEMFLRIAFEPPTLTELTALADNSQGVSNAEQRREMYGRYDETLRDVARHDAILISLREPSTSKYVRKFIESNRNLERLLGVMRNAANHSDDQSYKEMAAKDLAVNFSQVDHSDMTARVIASARNNYQPAFT